MELLDKPRPAWQGWEQIEEDTTTHLYPLAAAFMLP